MFEWVLYQLEKLTLTNYFDTHLLLFFSLLCSLVISRSSRGSYFCNTEAGTTLWKHIKRSSIQKGSRSHRNQVAKTQNEKPLGISSTITAFKQRKFETGQIGLITTSHSHIQWFLSYFWFLLLNWIVNIPMGVPCNSL